MEFNRLPCSNNNMYDVVLFDDRFRYQLTMLRCVYWLGYLDSLILILHMKLLYKKSPLVTGLMRKMVSHAGLWWSARLDSDNMYMDGRKECEDIRDSREILDLYSYIYIFYLSNLLIYLLNNVHYTIVYWEKLYCILYVWLCVTSAEVWPWQLGIIPQLAPIHEADTSRQPSESVFELDLDWFR